MTGTKSRHKRGIVIRVDEDVEIDAKLEKTYLIDKDGNKYTKTGELLVSNDTTLKSE